eukprot:s593_g10.t1
MGLSEVDFFGGLLDLSEFSQRLPSLTSSRQSAFCWQVVARLVHQPVLAAEFCVEAANFRHLELALDSADANGGLKRTKRSPSLETRPVLHALGVMTQLVTSGQLIKTLARSCRGAEVDAVGMAAAGADYPSCDASGGNSANSGYARQARHAQCSALLQAWLALLSEAKGNGSVQSQRSAAGELSKTLNRVRLGLLQGLLKSRLRAEAGAGGSSLRLLATVLNRQEMEKRSLDFWTSQHPKKMLKSLLCLAIRATGEALQLAPKEPVIKEVLPPLMKEERCLRCCGRALRHHRPNTVLARLAMRLAKLLTSFVRTETEGQQEGLAQLRQQLALTSAFYAFVASLLAQRQNGAQALWHREISREEVEVISLKSSAQSESEDGGGRITAAPAWEDILSVLCNGFELIARSLIGVSVEDALAKISDLADAAEPVLHPEEFSIDTDESSESDQEAETLETLASADGTGDAGDAGDTGDAVTGAGDPGDGDPADDAETTEEVKEPEAKVAGPAAWLHIRDAFSCFVGSFESVRVLRLKALLVLDAKVSRDAWSLLASMATSLLQLGSAPAVFSPTIHEEDSNHFLSLGQVEEPGGAPTLLAGNFQLRFTEGFLMTLAKALLQSVGRGWKITEPLLTVLVRLLVRAEMSLPSHGYWAMNS